MSASIILALICGIVLGAILRRPTVKRVLDSESAAVARIRGELHEAIEWREKRLLSNDCGWSQGDDLRRDISIHRHFLEMLPEQAGATDAL